MATTDERKRRILDHVGRTSGTFVTQASNKADEKKQRILDHVKRSQG